MFCVKDWDQFECKVCVWGFTLCLLRILHAFLSSADFFLNQFFKRNCRNTFRVSNRLDHDQVRSSVGPDLGSGDDTSRQNVCFLHSLHILKCTSDLFDYFDHGSELYEP